MRVQGNYYDGPTSINYSDDRGIASLEVSQNYLSFKENDFKLADIGAAPNPSFGGGRVTYQIFVTGFVG